MRFSEAAACVPCVHLSCVLQEKAVLEFIACDGRLRVVADVGSARKSVHAKVRLHRVADVGSARGHWL